MFPSPRFPHFSRRGPRRFPSVRFVQVIPCSRRKSAISSSAAFALTDTSGRASCRAYALIRSIIRVLVR